MKISILKKSYLIRLLIILIFLSNIGFFISLVKDPNINLIPKNNDLENEIPYIDSGCKFTKIETLILINQLNKKFNGNLNINFYEHPTNFYCQGKPVFSNSNFYKISDNTKSEISIGIGANSDLDIVIKISKMLLLFIFISLIYSKFKTSYKSIHLQKSSILFVLFIFSFYSSIIYLSPLNALSNFLLAMLLGNYLFFLITKLFESEIIFKSLITLTIFPLLFYSSNASFFWLTLLYIINLKKQKNIKLSKTFYSFNLFILIAFVLNFENYFFRKDGNLFNWILFSNGRHKGGIVNINNGLQTLALIFDILILLFIFYVLIKIHSDNKNYLNMFFDSLLLGFIFWISLFLISQINSFFNYSVLTLLGLPESIDTVQSVHPDGINWRGLTPSHELTGFWMFLIASISSYMFIETKKLRYVGLLVSVLICLSLNSQRTALILFLICCLFFLVKNLKVNLRQATLVFIILAIVSSVFQDGFIRLKSRIDNLSYDYAITDHHINQLNLSYERIEKYDLEYLKVPDNDLDDYSNLKDFYSSKLRTENSVAVNLFSFAGHTFGREVQWIRFLNFNNTDGGKLIYGNGLGQSYELLDLLIQKPHSLYLTVFYQLGYFGLLVLFLIILRLLVLFINTKYAFIHLLSLLFFVNALKNEFLFTHNQIIIFIIFMLSSFFYSSNK